MSSVLLIAAICRIQLVRFATILNYEDFHSNSKICLSKVRPTMYEVVQELVEKMGYTVS